MLFGRGVCRGDDDFRYHGRGKIVYPNFTVYDGEFDDGELHGKGVRVESFLGGVYVSFGSDRGVFPLLWV